MKLMRILLGFLLTLSLARAGSAESFATANADYEAGRFQEAARAYEEIIKADGPRVSVLGNLGSAYFKLDDNGRAILSYERALLLEPRNPDLCANLNLARQQAAVFPTDHAESFWVAFFERYSRRAWSEIALFAAILLPLSTLAWVFLRGKKRTGVVVFAGLSLGVLAVALVALKITPTAESRGIILKNPATLHLSPFEKAESRGTLAAGHEVTLGEENKGYFWVSDKGSSLEGWIKKSDVSPVVP